MDGLFNHFAGFRLVLPGNTAKKSQEFLKKPFPILVPAYSKETLAEKWPDLPRLSQKKK